MRKNIKHVLLGLCVLSLCAVYYYTAKTSVPPSVSWYKKHATALTTQIQECSANPGQLAATISCQNAYKAQEQIDKNLMTRSTTSTAKRYGIVARNVDRDE